MILAWWKLVEDMVRSVWIWNISYSYIYWCKMRERKKLQLMDFELESHGEMKKTVGGACLGEGRWDCIFECFNLWHVLHNHQKMRAMHLKFKGGISDAAINMDITDETDIYSPVTRAEMIRSESGNESWQPKDTKLSRSESQNTAKRQSWSPGRKNEWATVLNVSTLW